MEIIIHGTIDLSEGKTIEDFQNEFFSWLASKSYSFRGGMKR